MNLAIIELEENMYKIGVDFLREEMVVAKNIYDSDGKVLLAAGVSLRENYIQKLKDKGISEIYIHTEETADVIIEDVIREQNRSHAKKLVKDVMERVQIGDTVEAKEISRMINSMIDDLLSDRDIMVNLTDMRAVDDYTFAHSVNVCVLSLLGGIALNYNQIRLRELGIGALLHDIGKVWIPHQILNKPGFLDDGEFNEIKKHAELGYESLKRIPDIPSVSSLVALTHHERFDGSGYPFGKKGQDIHEFSRIVAIADVYDALTSDRVYKKKIMPHHAIEYLTSMGNHLFDYEIVKKFIQYIAIYPVGSMVKISTGERAIVTHVDRNFPTRPRIRILYDERGAKALAPKELDLKLYPSIMVTDLLENG